MHPSAKAKALLSLLLAFSAACSESNGGLSGGVQIGDKAKKDESIGGNRGSANGAGKAGKRDSEDDEADQPAEVTGAFLTCAFMDPEQDVLTKGRADPAGGIDVACGLYRAGKVLAMKDLDVHWRLLRADSTFVDPRVQPIVDGAPFNVIVTVPVKGMNGTIQMDVRNPKHQRAAFRRSVWSITSFDARQGFDLTLDIQNQRGLAAQQQVAAEVKTPWWLKFVEILVGVIGDEAKKTATDDVDGSQPLVCDCHGDQGERESQDPRHWRRERPGYPRADAGTVPPAAGGDSVMDPRAGAGTTTGPVSDPANKSTDGTASAAGPAPNPPAPTPGPVPVTPLAPSPTVPKVDKAPVTPPAPAKDPNAAKDSSSTTEASPAIPPAETKP